MKHVAITTLCSAALAFCMSFIALVTLEAREAPPTSITSNIHEAFLECMQQDGTDLQGCEGYTRRLYILPEDGCEKICNERIAQAKKKWKISMENYIESTSYISELRYASTRLHMLHRRNCASESTRIPGSEEWCEGIWAATQHLESLSVSYLEDLANPND